MELIDIIEALIEDDLLMQRYLGNEIIYIIVLVNKPILYKSINIVDVHYVIVKIRWNEKKNNKVYSRMVVIFVYFFHPSYLEWDYIINYLGVIHDHKDHYIKQVTVLVVKEVINSNKGGSSVFNFVEMNWWVILVHFIIVI